MSTRVELGLLGLLGVLWLALSVFLATSESAEADVECFAANASSDPSDLPSFSTATYHAQYRVLMAFSIFNAILGALLPSQSFSLISETYYDTSVS